MMSSSAASDDRKRSVAHDNNNSNNSNTLGYRLESSLFQMLGENGLNSDLRAMNVWAPPRSLKRCLDQAIDVAHGSSCAAQERAAQDDMLGTAQDGSKAKKSRPALTNSKKAPPRGANKDVDLRILAPSPLEDPRSESLQLGNHDAVKKNALSAAKPKNLRAIHTANTKNLRAGHADAFAPPQIMVEPPHSNTAAKRPAARRQRLSAGARIKSILKTSGATSLKKREEALRVLQQSIAGDFEVKNGRLIQPNTSQESVSSHYGAVPATQDPDLAFHLAFVKAIFETGIQNCSPTLVRQEMIQSPDQLTSDRIKSRLQKFRQYVDKERSKFLKEYDEGMATNASVSTPAYGGQAVAMLSKQAMMSKHVMMGESWESNEEAVNDSSMPGRSTGNEYGAIETQRLSTSTLEATMRTVEARIRMLAGLLEAERNMPTVYDGSNEDQYDVFTSALEDVADPADLALIYHAKSTRFANLGEGLQLARSNDATVQQPTTFADLKAAAKQCKIASSMNVDSEASSNSCSKISKADQRVCASLRQSSTSPTNAPKPCTTESMHSIPLTQAAKRSPKIESTPAKTLNRQATSKGTPLLNTDASTTKCTNADAPATDEDHLLNALRTEAVSDDLQGRQVSETSSMASKDTADVDDLAPLPLHCDVSTAGNSSLSDFEKIASLCNDYDSRQRSYDEYRWGPNDHHFARYNAASAMSYQDYYYYQHPAAAPAYREYYQRLWSA